MRAEEKLLGDTTGKKQPPSWESCLLRGKGGKSWEGRGFQRREREIHDERGHSYSSRENGEATVGRRSVSVSYPFVEATISKGERESQRSTKKKEKRVIREGGFPQKKGESPSLLGTQLCEKRGEEGGGEGVLKESARRHPDSEP